MRSHSGIEIRSMCAIDMVIGDWKGRETLATACCFRYSLYRAAFAGTESCPQMKTPSGASGINARNMPSVFTLSSSWKFTCFLGMLALSASTFSRAALAGSVRILGCSFSSRRHQVTAS